MATLLGVKKAGTFIVYVGATSGECPDLLLFPSSPAPELSTLDSTLKLISILPFCKVAFGS